MNSQISSNPWMPVFSKTEWPSSSSSVSSKHTSEWSTSWTVPQSTVSQKQQTKIVAPQKIPQVPVKLPQQEPEVAVEQVITDFTQLSFVSKSAEVNPWIPQVSVVDLNKKKDPKSTIEEELSKQSLYKTELCRSFSETGTCRYGHKCQFAHGEHERRPLLRHPKYKTELCKRFATTGSCPYGARCRFIHPQGNLTMGAGGGYWTAPWANTPYTYESYQNVPKEAREEFEAIAAVQAKYPVAPPSAELPPQPQQPSANPIQEDSNEAPRRLAIFQHLTTQDI